MLQLDGAAGRAQAAVYMWDTWQQLRGETGHQVTEVCLHRDGEGGGRACVLCNGMETRIVYGTHLT